MMTTQSSAEEFFTSKYFAVAGASSNPSKYGHKVFKHYLSRSLPVTPINPASPSIIVSNQSYPTVPNLSALPHLTETSLSVITPPEITRKVLQEAKELGIRAVWLQPGSFEENNLEMALKTWEGRAIGGDGGRGDEGWCVLLDGDSAMKAAGKL